MAPLGFSGILGLLVVSYEDIGYPVPLHQACFQIEATPKAKAQGIFCNLFCNGYPVLQIETPVIHIQHI